MLKIDGKIVVLPKVFPYLDFALKQNKIANPSVAPDPPICTNHCKNGSTPICVATFPAATAAVFWSNKINQIGLARELTINLHEYRMTRKHN